VAITFEKSETEGMLSVVSKERVSGAGPERKSGEELALSIQDLGYIVVLNHQRESLVRVDNAMVGFPKEHSPYLSRADGSKWVCDEIANSACIKECGGKCVKEHSILMDSASQSDLHVAER
jgi:hypothetical protein